MCAFVPKNAYRVKPRASLMFLFQVCPSIDATGFVANNQQAIMAKQPQLRMYKQYSLLVTVGRGRPRF